MTKTPSSLVSALYADRQQLRNRGKIKWFWGPQSMYSQLVDCLGSTEGHELLVRQCPGNDPFSIEDIWNLSQNQVLRRIARLRLAGGDYDAAELVEILSNPPITDLEPTRLQPNESQRNWFQAAEEWMKRRSTASQAEWSLAYWRALGFVSDWLNRTGRPLQETIVERTPILLANETFGRVLWLVAERMPGPPIVTPHWWRLGLVPLGSATQPDVLVQEIQTTLRRSLRTESLTWQVRWWLESYPSGGDWPDSVDPSPSIRASVASLVLALAEERQSRPVLDSRAAVSADTNEQEKLCDVGHLPKKIEACKTAGIQCLVLSPAMVKEWRPYAKQHAPELQLMPASSLRDAYEIVQATSPTVQKAKQRCVETWSGEYVETETDERFVEAANANANANR